MKLTRLLCSLTLGMMLIAGIGCKNNQVVMPTDEEAKKKAEIDPGSPAAAGKMGSGVPGKPDNGNTSPFKIQGMPEQKK